MPLWYARAVLRVVIRQPRWRHIEPLLEQNLAEHEVVDHLDEGTVERFRAVIAPTFADIFFSNAGKNGIVLVRLTEEQVAQLLQNAKTIPNYQLTVSLEAQTVTDEHGFPATFEVDPFRKFCLIEGLDDIGLTLRHAAELDAYETQHDHATWLKAK